MGGGVDDVWRVGARRQAGLVNVEPSIDAFADRTCGNAGLRRYIGTRRDATGIGAGKIVTDDGAAVAAKREKTVVAGPDGARRTRHLIESDDLVHCVTVQ